MLGQNMMAWVKKKTESGNNPSKLSFSGISIIPIGVLPPVGDRLLFAQEGLGSHGHTMYNLFTNVAQGGIRMENRKFRERLCNNQSTETDWITLLQHTPTIDKVDEFTEATCLFH